MTGIQPREHTTTVGRRLKIFLYVQTPNNECLPCENFEQFKDTPLSCEQKPSSRELSQEEGTIPIQLYLGKKTMPTFDIKPKRNSFPARGKPKVNSRLSNSMQKRPLCAVSENTCQSNIPRSSRVGSPRRWQGEVFRRDTCLRRTCVRVPQAIR